MASNRTIGRAAPPGPDYWPKRLAQLEAAVRELQAARTLQSASIGAGGLTVLNGGGLTISGALDVSGDAAFAGDTSIGGDLAVTGTLSLPNGVIDNDALANPIAFAAVNDMETNFALSHTAISEPVTVSIPVPAGFGSAVVFAVASLSVVQGSSTASGIAALCRIGSASQPYGITAQFASGAAVTSSTYSRALSGLSGGSITVACQAAAEGNANVAAAPGTVAALSAFAVFSR